MEFNLAIKRGEVLIHSTTWMKVENMISQQANNRTARIVSFHLCETSGIGKNPQRERKQISICLRLELGEGEIDLDFFVRQ